jgi:hypothetical protein
MIAVPVLHATFYEYERPELFDFNPRLQNHRSAAMVTLDRDDMTIAVPSQKPTSLARRRVVFAD